MTTRRPPVIAALCALAVLGGCGPPPPAPLPPDSFAFGVFGDGPYYAWERGRWRRVLADVRRSDVQWLLHIGDLFWYPCSDALYARRARELGALDVPVVYTPGDNEWADCHGEQQGRRDPLERLAVLRRTFFATPARSLGGSPLALETQAADSGRAEFVENARWTRGGFVFATLHVVGWGDSPGPEAGRPARDSAMARRLQAAAEWLDATFAAARARSATGVVLVMHTDLGLDWANGPRTEQAAFTERLRRQVAAFAGPVLLIHGDSHEQRLDHPLRDSTGRTYDNFTRLETFGSPDIGWIRVVVDTVAGRVVAAEPRRMRGWW